MLKDMETGTYKLTEVLSEDLLSLDPATIMTLLVAKIIQRQDAAKVSITKASRITVLEADVHQQDRRFLIGRGGRIAESLRCVCRAIQGAEDTKHTLHFELLNDGPPRRYRSDR